MYGGIKQDDAVKHQGDTLAAIQVDTSNEVTGVWSGFIREDNLEWWRANTHAHEIILIVKFFSQRQYEFTTLNQAICGYQLSSDVVLSTRAVATKGSIRIVTREARTDFEKQIDERWPVIHNKKDYEFTAANIIRGQEHLV